MRDSLIFNLLIHEHKLLDDDALTRLVKHFANRTLIVSCTKDNT